MIFSPQTSSQVKKSQICDILLSMSNYLNSSLFLENFRKARNASNYVDKSPLIRDLVPSINDENRFVCITRPRRFGKSIAANMIASFFGKVDSTTIFEGLAISKETEIVKKHQQKHNVIFIDFSQNVESDDTFDSYLARIISKLKQDILSSYQNLNLSEKLTLSDLLKECWLKTGEGFFFIFDEWDAPFRFDFASETDKKHFVDFLHVLLKGQAYVEFAYMTGILPIKKYSSTSDLNMFLDYSLATQEKYSLYFGFTENEVDSLYQKNSQGRKLNFTRADLQKWYDGYITENGMHLYNPRSIIAAFSNNQLGNYWTSSGPSDEVFNILKLNVEEIQKPVAQLLAGESVNCIINENAINSKNTGSKLYIFSAMVVYGLLSMDGKTKVKIPNYEIMQKFDEALQENNGLGYINQLAMKSSEMLDAILNNEEKKAAELLEFVHDTETPLFEYNRENELTAVVNLAFLAARDSYFVTREDKAGKGFTDFIFTPKNPADDCIILELKVDSTPQKAIEQIKRKNYIQHFKAKLGESPYYTGRILLVGISYDKKEKKHFCKIEEA